MTLKPYGYVKHGRMKNIFNTENTIFFVNHILERARAGAVSVDANYFKEIRMNHFKKWGQYWTASRIPTNGTVWGASLNNDILFRDYWKSKLLLKYQKQLLDLSPSCEC